MLRRNRPHEKMVPELVVLLRHPSRYPGDRLQGVVILDLPSPSDIIALEVRILGNERSSLGGLLFTDRNPEARHTTYYDQFITLRGVDHDLLQTKQSLLRRHFHVISRAASTRKSMSLSSEAQTTSSFLDTVDSQSTSSVGGSVAELTPSVIASTFEGAFHLVPGIYSYPFSTVLPDSLPASREVSHGRDGRCVLRYHVIASLIMTNKKVYTSEARLRINPLPVQVQRWYQLHENEQVLLKDAQEAADADDTKSRSSIMIRLMSSAGTRPVDKTGQNDEAEFLRCMHHFRQFPKEQLDRETARYRETASERIGKKDRKRGKMATMSTPLAAASETPSVNATSNHEKLQRQEKQEEEELRSLDGEEVNDGMMNHPGSGTDDQVYIFSSEGPLLLAPTSTGELNDESSGVYTNGWVTGEGLPSLSDEDGKMKPRRSSRPRFAAEATTCTAMVEENVENISLTPHEEQLPIFSNTAHFFDQREAVSSENKPKNREEAESEKQHNRTGRDLSTIPLQWKQEFIINLRSGVLRTGKVRVLLTLRSPVVTVGSGKVSATVLVDNSGGSGNISRIKYSLVTRSYIRTKTEVFNYEMTPVETSSDVDVKKGKSTTLPEVELLVPKSAPLTMLTEGMGTLTFLKVRLYVNTSLKTFSKSVATEVVLVSGQDILNCSRRLLRWTCCFRRGGDIGACDITIRPPIINLSEKNSTLRVIGAGDHSATEKQGGGQLQTREIDPPSVASSSVSRSMSILRESHRISKEAPSLDARILAKALNYEEAVFIPRDDNKDGIGFLSHVDPMATLNPLLASAYNAGNTPAEDNNNDTL